MKVKLDLIVKEIQDLKLRIEVLKIKKSSRDDTREKREENTNRHRDGEDDIVCRIKIDSPIFDCSLDLKICSDWTAELDYYFNWYMFTKKSKIQLLG